MSHGQKGFDAYSQRVLQYVGIPDEEAAPYAGFLAHYFDAGYSVSATVRELRKMLNIETVQ